jgi:F-type H+-transporting ATPase subunit epsilon
MQPFSFSVISVSKTIFSGTVKKLTLPGIKGEMTLLANHMPLISELNSGLLSLWVNDEDKSKVIPFPGGFVEMRDNECVVYVKNDEDLFESLLG